jgi:hypothetical protein
MKKSVPNIHSENCNKAFVKNIGATAYEVHVRFSKSSKDDFNDKLIRLVKNDTTKKSYVFPKR